MFLLVVFIGIVLCGAILYLPAASGLTQVQKNKRDRKVSYKQPDQVPQYYGHDDHDDQPETVKDKLKHKLQVSNDDMPVRIALRGDHQGLRNRHHDKIDTNNDPNQYDYDIDELIAEENERATRDREHEFYKEELGKDREELV
ncbi:hypothetical protein DICA1_C04060 [Diutina catenulata]